MIGSLGPSGGTTVSFAALRLFLEKRGCDVTVIDTDPRKRGQALTALYTIGALVRTMARADIVTAHFSDRATVLVSPILATLCRLAGKPFALRQFGGGFQRTYAALPTWQQRLLQGTSLSADAVFYQTKGMMTALAGVTRNARWFPTARQRPLARALKNGHPPPGAELRCLYVGRVTRAKGALVAAQAVAKTKGTSLAVYGPFEGDLSIKEISAPNVAYAGEIPNSAIAETLAAHHVLLFPSVHPGEGYSGTLVEAAQVGLPIIANRWQSLPEMFTDDEVIFTEGADADLFREKLEWLQRAPENLTILSNNLLKRSDDYDIERVYEGFLAVCEDLVADGVD